MTNIIVIGAGSSGLMAAVTAAQNGAKVTLLEQNNKIGRKIYATGNGKCNFTNRYMDMTCFHGEKELYHLIFDSFSQEDTISFFEELGIMPCERNGYYYPSSEQAASVVRAFEAELKRLGVCVRCGAAVSDIVPKDAGYAVSLESGECLTARRLIVACGLMASPKLGSGEGMVSILRRMGYQFSHMVPALCGFYCKGARFCDLGGVRVSANVRLEVDGEPAGEDRGEVQLTDYGISGIPVFQVSRIGAMALQQGKKVSATLSFLPDISEEELTTRMASFLQRSGGTCTYRELLNGYLPEKLGAEIARKVHREPDDWVQGQAIPDLVHEIHNFKVKLQRVREFDYAQVCAGGLVSDQIHAETLESKRHPNLFFCGEVLDVDGICGGYNLQWAWTSGHVAGTCATMDCETR